MKTDRSNNGIGRIKGAHELQTVFSCVLFCVLEEVMASERKSDEQRRLEKAHCP